MNKYGIILIKGVVLGLLLVWAILTQDVGKIWASLLEIKASYFAAFFFVNVVAVALASTNIYYLLRPLGGAVPWRRLFYFDVLSLIGAYYTPGGVGGVGTLAFLLNREGVGLKDSTVVLLLDKAITLSVALCSLCLYVALVPGRAEISLEWFALLALALVLGYLVLRKFSRLHLMFVKILQRLWVYHKGLHIVLLNIVLSTMIFLLSVFQFLLMARAMGVEVVNVLLLVVSYGALQIINYLPISFGGVGVGEVAAIYLWQSAGLTSEQVIAIFVVVRVFTLLSTLIMTGVAILLGEKMGQAESQ